MINAYFVLLVLGLVCFTLAAFKRSDPAAVSYFPLGAALVTLAFLLSHF